MHADIPRLVIRTATQDDVRLLAGFFGIFEARPLAVDEFTHRFEAARPAETAILALSGEQAVGLASVRVVACLSTHSPHAQITELYVEKDHQGVGIEAALLERAEALAGQLGSQEMTLLTGLKNAASQSLFRSLGYRDYALAMRKQLR